MTTRMRIESPIDMLAVAPIAIGFTPTESIVMLTFGGPSFHARMDLPTDAVNTDLATEALLAPCKQHGATSAVFVIYTEDTDAAMRQFASLRDGFHDAEITVHDVVVVTDGRWTSLLTMQSGDADVSTHPMTVQAIAAGRVTRGSRDELRNDIAMRDTLPFDPTPITDATHGDMVSLHVALVDLLDPNARFDDDQLAFYLAAIAVPDLRDTVTKFIARHGRKDNHGLRAVLADAAARAPHAYRAQALSVHALAAYMAGDGAAAWISVDETKVVSPNNSLAGIVEHLLTNAIAPEQTADMFGSLDD